VNPAIGAGGGVRDGSPGSDERPYRMSRRARLAVTLTVLAATVVIAVNAILSAGTVGTTAITVSSGDTLWSIAKRVAPQDETWAVVDQITDLNGLASTTLWIGQVLLVPAG
jgi:LysM repeat protein